MLILTTLVFSVFVSLVSGQQVTNCSNDCFDYNRICPAIKNQTFYDEYKELHEEDKLGIFNNAQLPPKPDCNNDFYKYACPRSCGECTPCQVVDLVTLDQRLKATETSFAAKLKAVPVIMRIWPTTTSSTPAMRGSELPFSIDGNEKTFYRSLSYNSGWARFEIPSLEVAFVRYQNLHCCDDLTSGTEVLACLDASDESCSKCGTVGKLDKFYWGTVICNKRASFIKLSHPSNELYITEIEIYCRVPLYISLV